MSIRGKSPSEVAVSATKELVAQEARLRPVVASSIPSATEGDVTGRPGDHWVNVESDGTVRIYENSVGANKRSQWRELISRTVGGTLALPSGTTLGGSAVYVAGGTDVVLADGGTSASLTADNGGIFYSTASAGAILASTATANKVLVSGASAAPSWSTPTFPNASATAGKAIRSDGTNWLASTFTIPDTMAISTLLYASAANVLSALATGNSGVLVTSGTGVPSIATDIPTAVTIGGAYNYRASGTDVAVADGGTGVGSWTNGQLLVGNTTGNTAALATLTGTTNQINVTNGASSITLSTPQNLHTEATPTFGSATITQSGVTFRLNETDVGNKRIYLNFQQNGTDFAQIIPDTAADNTGDLGFYVGGWRLVIGAAGDVLVGTTVAPSAGNGKVLVFGDNAAQPTMGLNTAGIYGYDSGTGTVEVYTVDEAGNDTLQTQHDKTTGEVIHRSTNRYTGRHMLILVEQLAREVERLSGKKFVMETWRPESERLKWDQVQAAHKATRDTAIVAWDRLGQEERAYAPRPAEYVVKKAPAYIEAATTHV